MCRLFELRTKVPGSCAEVHHPGGGWSGAPFQAVGWGGHCAHGGPFWVRASAVVLGGSQDTCYCAEVRHPGGGWSGGPFQAVAWLSP